MVFNGGAIISLCTVNHQKVRDVVKELWNLSWFQSARCIVIVDQCIDVHNQVLPWWSMVQGSDSWQHRLITDDTGKRLAIDATGRTTLSLSEPRDVAIRMENWQKEFGFDNRSI